MPLLRGFGIFEFQTQTAVIANCGAQRPVLLKPRSSKSRGKSSATLFFAERFGVQWK
jgi:hypothetical protein